MMDRPLAEKPEPGAIEISLTDKNPTEKAQLKSQGVLREWGALDRKDKTGFSRDGVRVEFLEGPFLHVNPEGIPVGIWVKVRAFDDTGLKLPTGDGIHIVINPPVKVPDGTARLEMNQDGEMVEVPNFVEDPQEALRQWLSESVRGEALSLGWKP